MDRFVYDMFQHIENPDVYLSTVTHQHLGVLENIDYSTFECNFNFNSAQEISFDVYKTLDDHECSLWNKLISFKYVYIPDHHEYYKIDVTLDQDNKSVKHIVGTSAGEYELSNRILQDLEINTEFDITYDEQKMPDGTYQKIESNEKDTTPTLFYNPYDTHKSLLHRVLADRAPDWSINFVQDSLAKYNRTFSVSNQSVYDFLTQDVAQELDCLFKFDSTNRTISVYDLLNRCGVCGERGEFTDTCPKCGSHNIIRGYGKDTHIYISAENYANKITIDGNEEEVKNCFRVSGGDELMTATVKNCNPAGSEYIYKFSAADYDDMPDELVTKLKNYYATYNQKEAAYQTTVKNYYNALTSYYFYKTSMMPRGEAKHWQPNTNYNVGDRAFVITLPSYCYLQCVTAGKSGTTEFDATNTIPSSDPSAAVYIQDNTVKWEVVRHIIDIPSAEQVLTDLRKYCQLSSTFVYFMDKFPADTSIIRYVSDFLAAEINPLLKVDILQEPSAAAPVWTHTEGNRDGTLRFNVRVTNTTNTSDTAVSTNSSGVWQPITIKCRIPLNGNRQEVENYMNQLVKKRLDRQDKNFTTLWETKNNSDFKALLKQYSLDALNGFAKSYQACRDVLIANGVKDNKDNKNFHGVNLYTTMYEPYNERMTWIENAIKVREGLKDQSKIPTDQRITNVTETVKYWYNDRDQNDTDSDIPIGKKLMFDSKWAEGKVQQYAKAMQVVHNQLDLKAALGDNYWKILYNYLRDGEYQNSNYISDGLSDNELVEHGKELLDKARQELNKASELQYTLTDDLNNLLNDEAFAPFKSSFNMGDYIICGVGETDKSDELDLDNHNYKLRLIGLSYNYGSPESVSVTFANVTKIKNYFSDTKDVLDQAKSMGSSYSAVTHQVDKNTDTSKQVSKWNENGLNSSLMQIQNNTKEEVSYDNNGITIKQYDFGYDDKKDNRTYNDSQLRLTHDMIAFTSDNWKTASAALGKTNYEYFDDNKQKVSGVGYGLIAKFVDAGFVHGSQMVGGSIFSENYKTNPATGTYMNLNNGDISVGGGNLTYTVANGLHINGSGTFTGTITATAGKIGNWVINGGAIKSSTSMTVDAGNGIYIGTNGIRVGNGSNYIKMQNGTIIANNVNLTGKITATSGSFTGTVYATSGSFKGSINATAFSGSNGNNNTYSMNGSGLTIVGGAITNPIIKLSGPAHSPVSEASYSANNIQFVVDNETYAFSASGTGNNPYFYSSRSISVNGSVWTNNSISVNSSGGYAVVNFTKQGNGRIDGNLTVGGTKNRMISTPSYGNVLQYAYETPTPMFGDVGEGKTDNDGICLIYLDDIYLETIDNCCEYQVFLQSYGDGNVIVKERTPSYFCVYGTPNLAFGWEVKAVQRDYETCRLDRYEGISPEEEFEDAIETTWDYLEDLLFNVDEEDITNE